MRTHSIDRLTGTLVFRALLLVSAVFVLPVLALGLLFTPFFLAMMRQDDGSVLGALAFAGLSLGGAVGILGWARAFVASRRPERHNLTAILVCLTVGVLTALAVTGYLLYEVLEAVGTPWGNRLWVVGLAFAAATAIWALDGLGWMQRLVRLYREHTGRPFDGLPALLLVVAVALATAAMLAATTL